jgi:Outer membrane protein beta-barrel domain
MKISVLTFFLSLWVVTAFSQLPKTLDFGIKGGINSSQMITTDGTVNSVNYTNFITAAKSGFNLGIFARLGGKRAYLQPEILYCQKNGESLSGPLVQTLKTTSIQVPILLGYKLINLKFGSLHAVTGPALSYSIGPSKLLSSMTQLNLNPLKTSSWNWQLGGGIDILMFTLDLRYEWGISPLSGLSSPNIGMGNKLKLYTFSIGFKFI